MEFINEVLDRGIPGEAFFFYYHGLHIGQNNTPKHETNILAIELRDSILEQMPRYGGVRPPISVVLYTMEKGKFPK